MQTQQVTIHNHFPLIHKMCLFCPLQRKISPAVCPYLCREKNPSCWRIHLCCRRKGSYEVKKAIKTSNFANISLCSKTHLCFTLLLRPQQAQQQRQFSGDLQSPDYTPGVALKVCVAAQSRGKMSLFTGNVLSGVRANSRGGGDHSLTVLLSKMGHSHHKGNIQLLQVCSTSLLFPAAFCQECVLIAKKEVHQLSTMDYVCEVSVTPFQSTQVKSS